MVIRPGIQVKPVKSDPLVADRYFSERRADLRVEAVAVHAKVERRIAQANQPG
jgi:hypothetical protein